MSRAAVELRVGGQNYRVVASAEESELRRLAGAVDARLEQILGPKKSGSPQALLLVALALAHDLEEERAKRRLTERRARESLQALLARIDAALEATEPGESGLTPEPPHADL